MENNNKKGIRHWHELAHDESGACFLMSDCKRYMIMDSLHPARTPGYDLYRRDRDGQWVLHIGYPVGRDYLLKAMEDASVLAEKKGGVK